MFKKSSYSNPYGNCVEVDLDYVKSSFSDFPGGNSVEVGLGTGFVHVRDSKEDNGPILHFDRKEWDAFIKGAKDGEFDL